MISRPRVPLLTSLYYLSIFLFCSLNQLLLQTECSSNETDLHSLIAIRDGIQGGLSSWNQSFHFCQWRGITCRSTDQRVISLNISSQSLVGSISPHIGNLSFLRVIHLQNNNFYGEIPQEIGHLFRLQGLRISNNTFEGEIPVNISQCTDLRILDLSGNKLSGMIPTQLGSLSNLVFLSLQRNNLTGEISPSIGMGPRKEKLTPRVKKEKKATQEVVEKSAPNLRLKTDDMWKKCFIEMCLDEVNNKGFSGTSLKSESWTKINEKMSKNYNVQYTQRQLKNQWDYLRKQYAAWRLLSKRTGHGVDFVGGVFEFPDEVWDDLIEKYPLTGQFRHAPLMNRELLESLFEPTLASGDEMFNHKHPIPMTNPPNDDVAKVQNIESDGDEDNQIHGADYFPNVTICGDYDPYTSQDVPMDDTQYNPSHDIPSDNEESPTYVQNTPVDEPPNQRQVPTTSRAKSDASSSQQKRKRDSIEPADPLVKSIGELVEMVKAETMGDKKLVDEGDAQVQELYVLGLLDDSLYLNSLEALSLHASHNKKLLNLQENRLKIQFLKNITSRMT